MFNVGDVVSYKSHRGLIIGMELGDYVVRFWQRNPAGQLYRWVLYLEADDLR